MSTPVYITLTSCTQCRSWSAPRYPTGDSFEVVHEWKCGAVANKRIALVDIEDLNPPIPFWCPHRHHTGQITDGYHTFDELYQHRRHLFIALMRSHPEISWRANNHHDGTGYDGYFIAGMHLPTGDISYHLPVDMWEQLDYSRIATSLRAPEWDGHTSADVVARLRRWSSSQCPRTYEVGKEVFIDGSSGFCDPTWEKITGIETRHDEKTGIPYQLIICGDQHYRSDTGECVRGAKAYFMTKQVR